MRKVLSIIITILVDILVFFAGVFIMILSFATGGILRGLLAFAISILLIVILSIVGGFIAKDKQPKIKRDKKADKRFKKSTVIDDDMLDLKQIKKIAAKYQYGVLLGKSA